MKEHGEVTCCRALATPCYGSPKIAHGESLMLYGHGHAQTFMRQAKHRRKAGASGAIGGVTLISRRFDQLLAMASKDTLDGLEKVDALLFSHDVDRSEWLDGKAWSRIIDSTAVICGNLGLSTAQVLHPYSKLGGARAHGEPLLMNRAWFTHRLKNKLSPRVDDLSSQTHLYQEVLREAHPRIVFTVGLPQSLAVAANSLNIPVVEVLHGKGYADIPWGFDHRESKQLPTDVFALDERSAVTFSQLQPKGVITHRVADPWLELLSKPSSQVPDEWRWPKDLSRGKKRIVVVSLVWGYAGDHGEHQQFAGILPNGLFPTEIETAILRTSRDTQWLFRLHPVQMHGRRYAWAPRLLEDLARRHANVEWRTASRTPLPTLLAKATHHVTMLSGSAYDAAEMGVPSALLCPTARPGQIHGHWYQDLIDYNYITRVDLRKSDQLLEWLAQTGRREPLISSPRIAMDDAISRVLARSDR